MRPLYRKSPAEAVGRGAPEGGQSSNETQLKPSSLLPSVVSLLPIYILSFLLKVSARTVPSEPEVDMDAKDISAIARKMSQMMWAMAMKQKKPDLHSLMSEERYQRTMSDEYTFRKPTIDKFSKVPEEQKSEWQKLAQK